MLYGIIISIITIIAILLIVVVLLQPGQKEGLTGGLAAGMAGGAAMGARRTADLLSKTTTILATLFLALSVVANFAIDRGGAASTIQQHGVPGLEEQIPGQLEDNFTAPSQTQPAIPQQEETEEGN